MAAIGIEVIYIDLLLGVADGTVGALEHCDVQVLLAAEVVVDHPLGGPHLGGDTVHTGAGEAVLGELAGGDQEDLRAGLLGVALTTGAGLLRFRRGHDVLSHDPNRF